MSTRERDPSRSTFGTRVGGLLMVAGGALGVAVGLSAGYGPLFVVDLASVALTGGVLVVGLEEYAAAAFAGTGILSAALALWRGLRYGPTGLTALLVVLAVVALTRAYRYWADVAP